VILWQIYTSLRHILIFYRAKQVRLKWFLFRLYVFFPKRLETQYFLNRSTSSWFERFPETSGWLTSWLVRESGANYRIEGKRDNRKGKKIRGWWSFECTYQPAGSGFPDIIGACSGAAQRCTPTFRWVWSESFRLPFSSLCSACMVFTGIETCVFLRRTCSPAPSISFCEVSNMWNALKMQAD